MLALSIFVLLIVALLLGTVIGHWCGWSGGYNAGQMREREAVVRAMTTIRKHYAVVMPEQPTEPPKVAAPPPPPTPCEPMTAEDWCARNGTSMAEMAEAQEEIEAGDDATEPIGRCDKCGAPVYTVPGYCGHCEK
jgi:hypothetical protein